MDNQVRIQRLNTILIQACQEALLQDRTFIFKYYKEKFQLLTDSLCLSLEEGIHGLHAWREDGDKGSLSYLQFSFLMSGQFSGEHLMKIDFYDDRFYADPCEIDCFWDYSILFPKQEERMKQIISHTRKEQMKIMDYEIHERLSTYRLGQMMLLSELMTGLLSQKKISSLLLAESERQIKVIYGAYMGNVQKLCIIEREQP